ncbi:caspase domain-containing protein [Amycolatopsis sp. NPDC051758]|uniref:caspase domain-containing protein n=1 Tax=Amycolatopsis sp. NPDC051758 TaxID=3363935 RepID=UPI0037ABD049
MPEPDLRRSSAVLVGTSVYAANVTGLHNLPSVDNNLTDLTSTLTDPAVFGLPPSQCLTIRNAPDARSVFRTLRQYAMSTEDTLIVYFAGHGLLSHNNDLYLSLSGTDPDELQVSALQYQLLREILVNSRATNRILILDCCFSGNATEGMSNAPSLNIAGTYIVAATPPTEMALAPIGERHTAFTGALLELLRRGIPQGPTKLTLSDLYGHLWNALNERGLPQPQQRTTGHTADLAMFHNTATSDLTDTEITITEPLPPTVPVKSRRPSRRTTIALSTAATAILLASGLTYAIAAQSDTPSHAAPPPTSTPSDPSPVSAAPPSSLSGTITSSAPTTSTTNKQAPDATLLVRNTWPTMRGCDGGTAVAMPAKGPALNTFPAGGADLREQVVARGGAFWLSGFIYLFMSAETGKTVDILEITPSLKPANHDQAAWVYLPQGGCGGRGSRVFDLNLDSKKIVDKGIDSESDETLDPSVNPDAKLARTEPLGQTFSVSQDNQALVRIDAHGCKANYTFNLNVSYSIAGDTAVHLQSFGPFKSNASSGDTPVYATESPDGQNWQFVKTGNAETYYKCK